MSPGCWSHALTNGQCPGDVYCGWHSECLSQRMIPGVSFLSTTWVPRIELRSSGLVAGIHQMSHLTGPHHLHFFDIFIFILCARMFCLYVCKCTLVMQSRQRPEEALDLLELELGIVVSHHIAAGNQAQVLWKNSQYS